VGNQRPGRLAESVAEHRALMRSIEARDAKQAERLMHDHLIAQLDALKALRAAEQSAPGEAVHAR